MTFKVSLTIDFPFAGSIAINDQRNDYGQCKGNSNGNGNHNLNGIDTGGDNCTVILSFISALALYQR